MFIRLSCNPATRIGVMPKPRLEQSFENPPRPCPHHWVRLAGNTGWQPISTTRPGGTGMTNDLPEVQERGPGPRPGLRRVGHRAVRRVGLQRAGLRPERLDLQASRRRVLHRANQEPGHHRHRRVLPQGSGQDRADVAARYALDRDATPRTSTRKTTPAVPLQGRVQQLARHPEIPTSTTKRT